MSARDRILGKVRAALVEREVTDHPGDFGGWRPENPPTAVEAFRLLFEAAGGEVVRQPSIDTAAVWIETFCSDFGTATVGRSVGADLAPSNPSAEPARADVSVSLATGAVAETGSLVMDARDGRRAQLLAPVHVIVVLAETVFPSLRDAFVALSDDLPSAIGLHSGPSKSADIGQIMVKGVHGPGRVVAVVVGE